MPVIIIKVNPVQPLWLVVNGRKYMQLRSCGRCPVRVPLMFVRKTAARIPLKPQLSYIFCQQPGLVRSRCESIKFYPILHKSVFLSARNGAQFILSVGQPQQPLRAKVGGDCKLFGKPNAQLFNNLYRCLGLTMCLQCAWGILMALHILAKMKCH